MSALGTFRHLVTLERPGAPTMEPSGGYTDAWTPLTPATWHCAIRTATATDVERIAGGVITATAQLLLRGRYHAELVQAGAAARIRWQGRTFTVASVHDREERGIELDVLAREVTGAIVPPTAPPTVPYADQVIADGAAHYWRLGELGGTFALDTVAYAHGTLTGGVTLNQPGALMDGNPAMAFDGTGSIYVADSLVPLPVTVEAWVLVSGGAGYRTIVSTRGGGDAGGLLFGINGPNALTIFCDTGTPTSVDSTQQIAIGRWVHVAFVHTGVAVTFYIDGAFARTLAQTRPAPSVSTIGIGRDPGTQNPWHGSIDEVALYPLALTPAQLAAHYTAATGLTPSRERRPRAEPKGSA